jgi:nucleotide-binding universal stress UspA family protein
VLFRSIWYDQSKQQEAQIARIVVPLNGAASSEQVLPVARTLARSQDAELALLTVNEDQKLDQTRHAEYLNAVTQSMRNDQIAAFFSIKAGERAAEIDAFAAEIRADVIAMTTGASAGMKTMIPTASTVAEVIKRTLVPVLVVRHSDNWRNRFCAFRNILVALDGSESAESVLPYIRTIARAFKSNVTLLFVGEDEDTDNHAQEIQSYLNDVARVLKKEGLCVSVLVTGSDPARTILEVSAEKGIDLLMMASHGRSGTHRPRIHLGSVAGKVLKDTTCPLFIVPLTRSKE